MLIRQIMEHIENLEFIIEIDSDGFSVYTWRLLSDDITPIIDYYVDDWKVFKDPLGCLCLSVSNRFWG